MVVGECQVEKVVKTTGGSFTAEHIPVLVREVVDIFEPVFGYGTIIDATVGGGGHSAALLSRMQEKGIKGRIIGIDIDRTAIAKAKMRLASYRCRVMEFKELMSLTPQGWREEMVYLVRTSYGNVEEVVERLGAKPVAGVFFDLGISGYQLSPERGFSFEQNGPLDMRFNPENGNPTARDIIRRASLMELKRWLRFYGEEPFSGRIARRIYELRREISTTQDLAMAIGSVVPKKRLKKTLARVFQAFRVVVNEELKNLKAGLSAALQVLAPQGRLAVICYQSGEDRLVKELLRREKGKVRALTGKPIRPTALEIKVNPRARSARLRVMVRL